MRRNFKKQFEVFFYCEGSWYNPITKLNYLYATIISFREPHVCNLIVDRDPNKLIVKLQPFSNKINNSILQGFRLWSQYSLPSSFPYQLCATFPHPLSPFS